MPRRVDVLRARPLNESSYRGGRYLEGTGGMRPPSHSTAELFSQLKAAYSDFEYFRTEGSDAQLLAAGRRIAYLSRELGLCVPAPIDDVFDQ